MLYTVDTPEVKVLEESMTTYFNILQGFVLLSHGSSVSAGPTLSSCINASVKQVVDSSFLLLQGAVSSYGSSNKSQKRSIPQLVGAVWEACSALKKTPASNVTAIGRAMTQVTIPMKDVLREMKELKPASSDQAEDKPNDDDDDDSCDGDLGNDLSPEEMKIVQLTTTVVSETLVLVKELIRSITALLQQESSDGKAVSVDSLEKLLKLCQETGVQVDELGACLYPPQEISAIKMGTETITSFTKETETELLNLKGVTQDFTQACTNLRISLRELETELGCPTVDDLVPQVENLVVTN